MNLAENLVRTAQARPGATALTLPGLAVTYEELDAGSRRVAAFLRDRGVGAGDRVGLMLPNLPSSPASTTGRSTSAPSWSR